MNLKATELAFKGTASTRGEGGGGGGVEKGKVEIQYVVLFCWNRERFFFY